MALKQRHKVGWNTHRDMAYSPLKRNTSVFEIQTRDILTLLRPGGLDLLFFRTHLFQFLSQRPALTTPSTPQDSFSSLNLLKIIAISLL